MKSEKGFGNNFPYEGGAVFEGILKCATKPVSEGNTGKEHNLKAPEKRPLSREKNFQTLSEWLQKKLIEPEKMEEKIADLRARGLSIATLNGSFDLMHAGHLYIIHEASKQADLLIVALNSDRSIQKYKSQDRPIISLEFRLEMMAALEFVDFVTWFEETDPRELLFKIKPDVHVNGAEYGTECIEAEVIKAVGGKLHLVDRIPSLATSSIIEKIKKCV